jgi:hypothetical protein
VAGLSSSIVVAIRLWLVKYVSDRVDELKALAGGQC